MRALKKDPVLRRRILCYEGHKEGSCATTALKEGSCARRASCATKAIKKDPCHEEVVVVVADPSWNWKK